MHVNLSLYIQVSVAAGAILAGASPEEVKACETYALDIGLAFQGMYVCTACRCHHHHHCRGMRNSSPTVLHHYTHTVADDILDVTASTEALGKTAGKDLNMDKTTYPKLLGLDGSREEARRLVKEAKAALGIYGQKADALLAIADYIVEREN